MIRLQTFGGAVLFGDDGARLLGAASQRRVLGLLSLLAAAGERGLSRDKIIGLLWPDSSPRRARHSLTQTMYVARRALRCDDLFEATEDVRLNPARISSDVIEFEVAVRSGDDSISAALYRGPFLDGFFLAESEFDWWRERQRTRLEDEAVAALQRLASAAEEAGEWAAAVACLRRLVRIRPSDSSIAMRLMKALATAGDRAGALRHASAHEMLLREQYELDPEPEVLALVAELRAGAQASPSPETAAAVGELGQGRSDEADPLVEGEPASRAPDGSHEEADAAAKQRLVASTAPLERFRLHIPRRARKAWWLGIAAVAVLGLAFVALRAGHRPATRPPTSLRQRVVVAPFRVAGADPSLAYLRDGMVDMLSTRLADDTAARSVDPGAVLAAWREAGVTALSELLPRDSAVHLAARLGAERVVVGSVVGSSTRLVLSAAVLAVPSGASAGQATVQGSADNLAELVDHLAAKLLLVEAGESDRLSDHLSGSLPALRAYLAGVAADAKGDHAVATRAFARALRIDSAFALAALHLGVAAGRLNDFTLERQALDRAWKSRLVLSDRDEAELVALLGPAYPAASTVGQALAAWDAAVRLAPSRGEIWSGLAERILIDGNVAGLGDVRGRSATALQRALTLDPNDAAARLLMMRIGAKRMPRSATQSGDTAVLPMRLFLRWRSAAERSDARELAAVADSLPAAGPANLRQIAATSAFDGVRPADGSRALQILGSRAADADQALGVLVAQHSLALERGRPGRALEITRDIGRLGPTGRPHLRLRVLDAVFAEGDTAAASTAAEELRRTAATSDLPNASADACALAQWQLARFDTAGARAMLSQLRSAPSQLPPAAIGTPAPVCASLVEAALAVATDRADARAQLARVDSLVFTSVGAGDAAAYAPILISRLFRRVGDPARALAAIRRRPSFGSVWPRYLATELREEGDLARETGDAAGAALAYRRYLSLRSDAEPSVAPQVRRVRAEVAALAPG